MLLKFRNRDLFDVSYVLRQTVKQSWTVHLEALISQRLKFLLPLELWDHAFPATPITMDFYDPGFYSSLNNKTQRNGGISKISVILVTFAENVCRNDFYLITLYF